MEKLLERGGNGGGLFRAGTRRYQLELWPGRTAFTVGSHDFRTGFAGHLKSRESAYGRL
jgi:hypothetical protein